MIMPTYWMSYDPSDPTRFRDLAMRFGLVLGRTDWIYVQES